MERDGDAALMKLGLVAIQQQTFEGCRNKRELKWDFYLQNVGTRGVLIEMDGNQHFKPWNGHADKFEDLVKIRALDKIKNQFAKKHYDFLRISWSSRARIEEEVIKFINDVQASPAGNRPIFRLIGKEYQTDEYKRLVL